MEKTESREFVDKAVELMIEKGCNLYVAMREVERTRQKVNEELFIQEQNN